MGERYPARERRAGGAQSVAHVAEKEVFGGRHAIGMRGQPALASGAMEVYGLKNGREPTPENVALGASQLAMALTDLLAKTSQNIPRANLQI